MNDLLHFAMMMVGRTDVELLSGGCHYRVVER